MYVCVCVYVCMYVPLKPSLSTSCFLNLTASFVFSSTSTSPMRRSVEAMSPPCCMEMAVRLHGAMAINKLSGRHFNGCWSSLVAHNFRNSFSHLRRRSKHLHRKLLKKRDGLFFGSMVSLTRVILNNFDGSTSTSTEMTPPSKVGRSVSFRRL